MKTFIRCSILIAYLFILHNSYAEAQESCAINWDPPMILSDTLHNAYSPHITLSRDDTIHIVWENGSFAERLPYVRSTDGGASYSPRRELLVDSSSFPNAAGWSHVACSNDRVYVVFVGSTSGDTPVRMLVSSNAGTDWSSVRNISQDTCGIVQDLAVHLDTVAVVYPPPPYLRRILRSTNGGESWTRSAGILGDDARITLSQGMLHLVQTVNYETQYRESSDLGDTWVEQNFISEPDGFHSLDPVVGAISSPGSSEVASVWRDTKYGCQGLVGCSIIARRGMVRSDTTEWMPEELLTDVPLGYEPKIGVSGERIAIAWPMDHYTAPYAQVRVWNGSEWCAAFDPADGVTTNIVTSVDVAISSKAVHVVWEAAQAPDPSTFRIFYRRGRFVDTEVKEGWQTLPPFVQLQPNYPNPFNPSTKVSFSVSRPNWVTLKVYDVLGQEVSTLVDKELDVGEHTVDWYAEGLPSGVYYYRLISGARVETRKAVLLR
jgi:hypothetical protein